MRYGWHSPRSSSVRSSGSVVRCTSVFRQGAPRSASRPSTMRSGHAPEYATKRPSEHSTRRSGPSTSSTPAIHESAELLDAFGWRARSTGGRSTACTSAAVRPDRSHLTGHPWSTSNRISLRRSRKTSRAALRGPFTFPLPASLDFEVQIVPQPSCGNRCVEERSSSANGRRDLPPVPALFGIDIELGEYGALSVALLDGQGGRRRSAPPLAPPWRTRR